jgi:SAM-dependent methyltransferase
MDLQSQIARNGAWYHSIELAPGVVTPGRVDLRRAARRVLPRSLAGQRCLDVGTFDGFWAFEHERRGAREVVAIDVERVDAADWPPIHRERLTAAARDFGVELGLGFAIAADALGSQVRRVPLSVYDLEPEAIGGPVDRAFIGALLLHLRDPVGALERVRGALRPGGTLQVVEAVDVKLTLRHPRAPVAGFEVLTSEFTWWYPNLRALRGWLETAGFTDVRARRLLRPPGRMGMRGIVYAGLTCTSPS